MTGQIIATVAVDTCPPFDPGAFWSVFGHETARTGGVDLHYVAGGDGPPVLLVPGWPQSWYAWRHVMDLLRQAGRRVIALDPRGMGDSGRPASGYDLQTVAADIHGLVQALGLAADGPLDVVGHDVGSWISYAHAADWPQDVGRLAVLDAALPGITQVPAVDVLPDAVNLKTWHFAFNRLDDLPEILLQGREREFLTWLFRVKATRPWTITPTDLEEYVRVNAAPGATRAALSYYRHVFSPDGLNANRRRAARPLSIPVLALGADNGAGSVLYETMKSVATDVRGSVFENCGHYMPEEAPRRVVSELLQFWAERDA
ncbi:alpha/beta hydrolase [Komagataeibacter rhaeticus]|uniref:alpha/beta fold hydrolase n=1 Tax=Komagataeibacter rhaeticus TaxID=215221 RepID=UPI0004D60FB5|nr:alpha/beta hydrolase [Komagataeibacter rhaeticus]KDU96564.1 alpha/beta hydrolase [Komagataeibacter rhaeticus AF1]PYD52976.1 alpha/beta hydrolase [Komagataeibacter rhaeticus]GBQ09105.1 putative hydrolase [Komagataeibacter rhaeticus DSM 16663]